MSNEPTELNQQEWELSKIDPLYLIKSLFDRGITLENIQGRYYEFEEASSSLDNLNNPEDE